MYIHSAVTKKKIVIHIGVQFVLHTDDKIRSQRTTYCTADFKTSVSAAALYGEHSVLYLSCVPNSIFGIGSTPIRKW